MLRGVGSVGPTPGERSCLAKVAVTSGFGYIIHAEGSSWEYTECTHTGPIQRISIQLRDASGAIVPLHGCDWRCCLTNMFSCVLSKRVRP